MKLLASFLFVLCQSLSVSVAEPESVNLRRTIIVDVAERTKDSVVYISTTKLVAQRFGPLDERFWAPDGQGIRKVPVGSLGSGFIVHPDGYIITNNHVVDRARQIQVELLDGRKLSADLISADPEADLAVLKINTDKPLPTLELGDSSDVLIGEPVIAVGNPLGFSHSVSTGIVSALHRDLKGNDGDVVLSDLIQTDAAINPGNSGGPLLNAYGQVIGINTAIRGDAQNIGFAIQVNRLRDLIPELMNPAVVNRVEVPIRIKEHRDITPPNLVTTTLSLGNKTETITTIAGQKHKDIIDAYATLLKQKPGESFDIELLDGSKRTISPAAVPTPDAIVKAREKLGLVVEQLTPLVAQKYGLDVDDGLFITQVVNQSVAERASLKAGDILLSLGRYRVAKLQDLSVLMQHLPQEGRVRVQVRRDGRIGYSWLEF